MESVSLINACKAFGFGVSVGFILSGIPALIGFVINKIYCIMQK